MPETVAFEVEGLRGVLRHLDPQWIGGHIADLIDHATLLTERQLKATPQFGGASPRDSGAGARAWRARTTAQGWDRLGHVTNPETYMAVLEVGRRPGARMPPPEALGPWARRHGFSGSLFVLARAIGRKGITRHKGYVKKAVTQVEREIPALLQRAARAIEGGM